MLHQLVEAWHRVHGWAAAYPGWAYVILLFAALVGFGCIRIMTAITTRLVIRRVFGGPTFQPPAEEIARARAEADAAMQRIRQELHAQADEMLSMAYRREIPFNVVVRTPEEQQILEAALARVQPRVVYRQAPTYGVKRRTKAEKEREESVPTAWTRILNDEDEDGNPCPTIPAPPPEPPPTPRRRKPSVKKA